MRTDTQKWIKNVEQLNARKERLNRKMRKNLKKTLKSNECQDVIMMVLPKSNIGNARE